MIADSPHVIEVGQTVGNYRVTAKLGEGGMGVVFLAEHPVIGRKAALKAIHPEHLRNAEVLARFVNEAKSINQIGHQHIVEVTDFGRTPAGDFYFIMEYLQGESLSETILREAPLHPERALAIAAQIADALEASHTCGVVHRDLKPENIFLVPRAGMADFVKVLDFGLAKLLHGDGAVHDTRAGIIMGTPCYMAPEQCQGRLEVDHRADVYALGVILFEMLTGKLPFGGDGYNDILVKQMTMRAPAARSIVPSLPDTLELVLTRALAKTPAERFSSMAEFREALLNPTELPPPGPILDAAEGAVPNLAVYDDMTERMRAARPMKRADLKLRRSPTLPIRTTFDEATGEVQLRVDDDDDLVPARYRLRSYVLVGAAALGAMALAAGVTYGAASHETALAPQPPAAPPRTVPVSFSSDPAGAIVTGEDGAILGTTPLSIGVVARDQPVEYEFRKEGFQPKRISLIPNVPSPVFALMQAETPPQTRDAGADPEPEEEETPAAKRARAPRPAHPRDRAPHAPALAPSPTAAVVPPAPTSPGPATAPPPLQQPAAAPVLIAPGSAIAPTETAPPAFDAQHPNGDGDGILAPSFAR